MRRVQRVRVLNDVTAQTIIEAFHAAWSQGDVTRMLSWCHNEITYFLNAGSADGGPMRLHGKPEMRAFLDQILNVATSVTVPQSFTFRADGIGRAQIEAFVQHRKTGNVLSGTYRQVIFFEDFKIIALEEFHDAAKMKVFWEMVRSEELRAVRTAERDD